MTDVTLQNILVAQIPMLRAVALALTADPRHADDLTRMSVVQALSENDRHEMKSDDRAVRVWLVKILHDCFEKQPFGVAPKRLTAAMIDRLPMAGAAEQGPFDFEHFRRAFWQLRPDQREVLIMAGAGGFDANDIADIRRCTVATAKSHATRARNLLKKILEREARRQQRRGNKGEDRSGQPAQR